VSILAGSAAFIVAHVLWFTVLNSYAEWLDE